MIATVRAISKEELLGRIRHNTGVQIVNVLEPVHHHLGFIRGSRRIPVAELDRRCSELDKSREVVTYCSGGECNAGLRAAERLADLGFNVRVYPGGITEWESSGLPQD